MASEKNIEQLGIDTARVLAADAVQKANSGHPGTPMALAPMGHVLWTKFLNYNPKNPDWANRDRFILSAGHACMLQYAFLYLTGYDLTLDDLKDFRQMNSKTAGHPEYGLAPGIDVTTGPLGQGFANAVGFAIAQKHLAARYNKPGFELFNYNIYTICSDGDLMEGVTSEAASLAGHLQLGNLIYLYDNNHISIEGSTDITFNEDVSARFRSYGWHVQDLPDVNDIHALELALINAKSETQKPSLINVRSLIAYGSPNKSGTAGSHGSPLGPDEIKLVKEFFGFDPEKSFDVAPEVLDYYRKKGERGVAVEEKWNKTFADYKAKFPELAAEYERAASGQLPEGWEAKLPTFEPSDKKIATRAASGKVLNAIADVLPNLIGGAADLSPSTETDLKQYSSFTSENRSGRNFHFGIREHAMGSALNGMALTKGLIPFGATFLMFSEYMRPPIRLAAIMKVAPIFVYTHDSIGLGEDGTTHQPVEQLASLRSIPNIRVIRPADANETAQAWKVALEHKTGPTVLVFTRQGLPVLDQAKYGKATDLAKGAYILSDSEGTPDIILIATGSEVELILKAQEQLKADGIKARVVSFPSWEIFEAQSAEYKESVLPKSVKKRLAVEAASPMGWHKYVTDEGDILGMTTFGESAPAEDLYKHFGFTVENVVAKAKAL
ncbi:transketolase [Mucilaginibacter myungsuensis]|uniref:Transketolase n=1 Tax=Mucilaginibacter myungsuensis TaxID=649104 RepID=A0A929PWB7_9SPHI|nr:transketolase [Mucilaginibacter myungsuensis]MBE9661911.1 transketolase [Mucilaginibacter myungsuensis]MDN3599655.1 transketolase [Mucilaginibacter myungsuensis]